MCVGILSYIDVSWLVGAASDCFAICFAAFFVAANCWGLVESRLAVLLLLLQLHVRLQLMWTLN